MEISIFLAKVLGFYFIIMGLFVLLRQQQILLLIKQVAHQSALVYITGIITLILGLLLVVSHNIWIADWRIIITIIAWLTLIAGIIRIFFHDRIMQLSLWWVKHKEYLIIMAVIYLLIGIFLLYKAFK